MGYALLGADFAMHARGRTPRAFTIVMAAVVVAHVLLVWTLRFHGSLDVALARPAGFVVFHAALLAIVAAAASPDRWRRRLLLAAFPVVTIGVVAAVFRYSFVALWRIPAVAILLATLTGAWMRYRNRP